jgi:hypothetical protein
MKIVVFFFWAISTLVVSAQQPPASAAMVDTPTVKVLTGLTVQEFEAEMQLMTQALGLSCGSCPRRMLEMTKAVNTQFFADYKPIDGESRLGRVTCFTCHQGDTRPKTQQ